MPLAVAHPDFILLFTIIFIIAYLFYAFIYVTGRYIYDRLYPEPCWTANGDAGVTTSHKGFNHRRTLHDDPFDRGHHTLQNQRQHVKDTQNVESFIEISDDSDSESVSPFTEFCLSRVFNISLSRGGEGDCLIPETLGLIHPRIVT